MLVKDLKIKLFADGANKEEMIRMNSYPHIQGFTTNPTLMRKAGVLDYEKYAKGILEIINMKPTFSTIIRTIKTTIIS